MTGIKEEHDQIAEKDYTEEREPENEKSQTAGKKKIMSKERLKKMIFLGIKYYKDPFYQGIAAQVAFFLMLSIVPTMMLMSQLLYLFKISPDFMNGWLDVQIPEEYYFLISYILKARPETTTNILLVVLAVWASSRIQFTMIRLVNYTFSGGKTLGNYWKERLRSMLLVIITVIVIALLIVVMVYGEVLIRFLSERLLISDFVDKLWTLARWPIAGLIYLLIVSFNYFVLISGQKIQYRDIMPGSIFCAAGMLIVTIFYSGYSAKAVSNNIIYGSMAMIAVLMFWFYFISWVLFLGILFNKVWIDTKE